MSVYVKLFFYRLLLLCGPLEMVNRIIFAINSLVSVVFVFMCIVGIVSSFFTYVRPFVFIGSVAFLPVPIVLLVFEWNGVIRKRANYLKRLSFMSFFFSAFVAFGYVSNVFEAISSEDQLSVSFMLWFSFIFIILFAYGIFVGVYRLKLSKRWLSKGASLS